jgi:hypothetical protein
MKAPIFVGRDPRRLARQCHRDGCSSESKWQLGLELQCCGAVEPLKCVSTVKVCDSHVDAGEAYLLSDLNRGAIERKLAAEGFGVPERVRPVVLPIEA